MMSTRTMVISGQNADRTRLSEMDAMFVSEAGIKYTRSTCTKFKFSPCLSRPMFCKEVYIHLAYW